MGLGFWVELLGLGFGVGFWVGFRVQGLGFGIVEQGRRIGVQGSGFAFIRPKGTETSSMSGLGGSGLGFRVSGVSISLQC